MRAGSGRSRRCGASLPDNVKRRCHGSKCGENRNTGKNRDKNQSDGRADHPVSEDADDGSGISSHVAHVHTIASMASDEFVSDAGISVAVSGTVGQSEIVRGLMCHFRD